MIMHQWRVTKYNPQKRDVNGLFLDDEWIMAQQIGQMIKGVEFTRDDYLAMEDRYVAAALGFFAATGLSNLQIKELHSSFPLPAYAEEHKLVLTTEFTEGQQLNPNEIEQALRMLLREIIGGQLSASNQFFIHVGWDYYMYIGSKLDAPDAKRETEKSGLFVEDCVSPYFNEN